MIWLNPLLATVILMAASVTIATVIGIPAAWAATVLHESNRIGKAIAACFVAILFAAVMIPLVLHAAAWEATAGKFGLSILTQTGMPQSGTPTLSGDSYGSFAGLTATALIHGLHGAAVMTLATFLGTSRMPGAVKDQARLSFGPVARWWHVRLSIASPWWIAVMIGTAGIAATEMTVADLYGYRTIADQFYLSYALSPSIGSVAWTCFFPLMVLATIITYFFISRRRPFYTNPSPSPSEPIAKPIAAVAAMIALITVLMIAVVPLGGLINNMGQVVQAKIDQPQSETELQVSWSAGKAMERWWQAKEFFASEYRWTAVIASVTSFTAVVIAWPLASLGRRRRRDQVTLDLVTIMLVCIPGPIVGLAVVSVFQSSMPGARFMYQQTIIPTVISLLARSLPVAYWIIRSGYQGIETSTLDMARMDTTRWQQFWMIERPLVNRSLIAALIASAVTASGDLPAMLPVLPAGVTTVPVRLFGLLHSGARYQEAALATWYVAVLAGLAMLSLWKLSAKPTSSSNHQSVD